MDSFGSSKSSSSVSEPSHSDGSSSNSSVSLSVPSSSSSSGSISSSSSSGGSSSSVGSTTSSSSSAPGSSGISNGSSSSSAGEPPCGSVQSTSCAPGAVTGYTVNITEGSLTVAPDAGLNADGITVNLTRTFAYTGGVGGASYCFAGADFTTVAQRYNPDGSLFSCAGDSTAHPVGGCYSFTPYFSISLDTQIGSCGGFNGFSASASAGAAVAGGVQQIGGVPVNGTQEVTMCGTISWTRLETVAGVASAHTYTANLKLTVTPIC